ncbi:hypothetical protein OIU34_26490 [Pararhizobium sp. BT-229]|uniref:hypothetical protein n=1 Tax=Pararhizobium sp. BT-229 TaxID=2986923 RepID=UPI0021F7A303|nr:hypothetical protein [Pararhizobium sp. BT-229]MCV9965431.1 hypothetical protein [Pararhizobium sp. BT-229]
MLRAFTRSPLETSAIKPLAQSGPSRSIAEAATAMMQTLRGRLKAMINDVVDVILYLIIGAAVIAIPVSLAVSIAKQS